MGCRIFQHLLVFVVGLVVFVQLVASKTVGDEFARQQIMKLLSIPQKSERLPNVFKIQVGGKLMVGSFGWSSCNASAPLKLNSITISPDPIPLKGSIKLGFNGTVGVDVVAGLNAKIVLKKKIAGIEIEIPCEDNVGSCTYSDVCGMIPPTPEEDCPPPFPTLKIPCNCPFKKGNYVLPATTFAIPPIQVPSWLASGDYQAGVKAYDKNGTNLACYDFKISIA